MPHNPGRSNKHSYGGAETPSAATTEPDEMPELLTPREAARYLRTTPNTLAQNRYLNRGMPYHRAGRRILYARADVLAYLATGRTDPQEAAV